MNFISFTHPNIWDILCFHFLNSKLLVNKNQKNLPEILKKIFGELIISNVDIDIERDSLDIENLRQYIEKENSLLISNPEIAKEWHYEKNGNLKPEYFAANSNKKVWWKCSNGHEWQAVINSRYNRSFIFL